MSTKKRERFVELAEKRVNRAIKDLRLIGNLANKSNYLYTDDDAKRILFALDAEIKLVRKRFDSIPSDSETKFTL